VTPDRTDAIDESLESSGYAPARATPVPGQPVSPFERVLHFGESRWGLGIMAGSLALAIGMHVLVGQAHVLLAARVSLPAFYKTSEYIDVEVPKEEPKDTPEPTPDPTEAKNPNVPQETKATQEPPPPAAARAGNLLTAPDQGAADDDTPKFVTDPNGNDYGSGVVAKGGTADVGKAGAAASGVPNGSGTGTPAKGPIAPPPAPTIVAAADLSRKANLPGANPCAGYFPADADDNEATVTVSVVVKPDGGVSSVSLVSEDPRGQGFGSAAKRCLSAAKLTPALDKAGTAVSSSTTFRIHFTR
jgi:TonB family protein